MADIKDSQMSEGGPIISSSPQPLTTITYTNRNINMLTLSSGELDAVASRGGSLHLTLFGLCFGALISFSIVLTTADGLSVLAHSEYVALTGVSAIGSLYFGIRGVSDHLTAKRELKRIKAGQ